MLCANNITMTYSNGVKALQGISLTIPNGHVYSLLGANGAGKSTLMYLFLDFIRPTSGTTSVDDIVIQNDPLSAQKKIAYLPDQVELFEEMSGFSNLSFFCKLAGNRFDDERLIDLYDQVRLERRWGSERVGSYSRGMKQKLGLAILLGRGASSFLLDEPTLGLDPQTSWDLVQTIRALRAGGASVLLSTHDLLRAKQMSDTVGIIRYGRLIGEYSREEIANLDLEQTYLEQFEYDKSSGIHKDS